MGMAEAFASVQVKMGLEMYSGSLDTLFLHLINYSLDSEGGLQMEANVLKSCCSCRW